MRTFAEQTPRRRTVTTCLLIAVLCATAGCMKNARRDTSFVNDAEPDVPTSVKAGRKWEEGDYQLPGWPRDTDLVEVKLDGPDQPLTHYIDTRSLDTGADGVVRYTLVTSAASGARNVSFEGLRCTPRGRWKTYAYGMDGHFKPTSVDEEWREIRGQASDPLHYDLWQHYLCVPRAFEARPERDQVRMLESGRVPRVEHAGFMPD
jgi:hypothetical protein